MTDTTMFVYILSIILLAFVWYIVRTIRAKPPTDAPKQQKGTSEYKYDGPRLVGNAQPGRTPRHVEYVHANHLSRKQRRIISSLTRRNKDTQGRAVANG